MDLKEDVEGRSPSPRPPSPREGGRTNSPRLYAEGPRGLAASTCSPYHLRVAVAEFLGVMRMDWIDLIPELILGFTPSLGESRGMVTGDGRWRPALETWFESCPPARIVGSGIQGGKLFETMGTICARMSPSLVNQSRPNTRSVKRGVAIRFYRPLLCACACTVSVAPGLIGSWCLRVCIRSSFVIQQQVCWRDGAAASSPQADGYWMRTGFDSLCK